MKNKKYLLIIFVIIVILIFAFGVNRILTVRKAHSTFENYYTFRGCAKLIKKTTDYGLCQLQSGKIIKLVKFQNKWYLDGDLPVCKFNFCF